MRVLINLCNFIHSTYLGTTTLSLRIVNGVLRPAVRWEAVGWDEWWEPTVLDRQDQADETPKDSPDASVELPRLFSVMASCMDTF